MKHRVRLRESFGADVRAQILWLRRHRGQSQVTALRDGLCEARGLFERFPEAGTPLDRREQLVLRKLVLRRVPFVVLYVVDGKDVWLLRLFHHRQDRPI